MDLAWKKKNRPSGRSRPVKVPGNLRFNQVAERSSDDLVCISPVVIAIVVLITEDGSSVLTLFVIICDGHVYRQSATKFRPNSHLVANRIAVPIVPKMFRAFLMLAKPFDISCVTHAQSQLCLLSVIQF
jgi:hypothetical protein